MLTSLQRAEITSKWIIGSVNDIVDFYDHAEWFGADYVLEKEDGCQFYIILSCFLTGNIDKLYKLHRDGYKTNNELAMLFVDMAGLELEYFYDLNISTPYMFCMKQNLCDEKDLYPEIIECINAKKNLYGKPVEERNNLVRLLYEKDDFDSNALIAELSFSYGLLDEALTRYLKCIELRPNNSVYWMIAARVCLKKDYCFLGLHLISQAIKLNPENAHFYLTRANLLFAYLRVFTSKSGVPEVNHLLNLLIVDRCEECLDMAKRYILPHQRGLKESLKCLELIADAWRRRQ